MKHVWKFAGLVFGVAVVIAGILFFKQVNQAVEGERNLHATNLVMDLLCEYIDSNNCWPGSWDDLSNLQPKGSHVLWNWPDDMEYIKDRVHVSFETPVDEQRLQDWVSSRQPTYGPSENWKEKLERSIFKTREGQLDQ